MATTAGELREFLNSFDNDALVVIEVYEGGELKHQLVQEVVARSESDRPVVYGYVVG